MLDPATVLSLFRRMTDQVHTILNLSRVLLAVSATMFGCILLFTLLALENTRTVTLAGE
uniref:Uncharacterized protein n=1 Tax=Arundo donax TaxID=35708 RepID=A0A0A9F373_ARUDO